jgi:hypothetical protein
MIVDFMMNLLIFTFVLSNLMKLLLLTIRV